MNAREEILARVRQAVSVTPEQPVPRRYRHSWDVSLRERLERLAARLHDLGVSVLRIDDAAGISSLAEQRLAAQHINTLIVPPDLPLEWLPRNPAPIEDTEQSPHELDGIQGVMTGCALAIAETGTIVLDGGPAQGRRAISLVPDYHLCVVLAEQVRGIVPEAIADLGEAARGGRPITFISGASATADIELSRVVGVHGPRTLEVMLVGGKRLP